jgi:hypothetical protein
VGAVIAPNKIPTGGQHRPGVKIHKFAKNNINFIDEVLFVFYLAVGKFCIF